MSRRLPPLYALRAFEAAARHASFTRAAEELAITQSAVSRHIRTLEEYFACRLFERRGRSLHLTDPASPTFSPDGCRSFHDILHSATPDAARRCETAIRAYVDTLRPDTSTLSVWAQRRLDDIVNMLIDAEEVVDVIVTPPNGGKKSSVLYLFKYAPSPEMKAA